MASSGEHTEAHPATVPVTDSVFRIGSRNSILALAQSKLVSSLLAAKHSNVSFPISTVMVQGDADKTTPFLKMTAGGVGSDAAKSLWTTELEDKLRAGELDILVHCLKDLPTLLPQGCLLGAVTKREDPSDAVLMKAGSPYKSLDDLPAGSVVGTSSIRRKALLKLSHPDLVVQECRGNVYG
jgi:hydroxymethylbilane synthase